MRYKIDTIISDNRYGIRHKSCKNVILCHQINILHPNPLISKIGSFINHKWINRFDECWIPDDMPPNNLSGALSDPDRITHPIYIGPLSRFSACNSEIKRDILVVLSGPEPKRSRLENALIETLKDFDFLLVRGVYNRPPHNNQRIKNHLSASELNHTICESKMVICRSGYTSIMDLVKLKKRAILIPTPGQPEQEYLAKLAETQLNPYFKSIKESEIEGRLSAQLTNTLPTS